MWPVFVEMALITAKYNGGVSLVDDQDAVEQFAADRSDEALGDRVRRGARTGVLDDPDIDRGEHGIEGGGELGVAVEDEEPEAPIGLVEVHEQVAGLLGERLPGGVGGDAQDMDAAGGVLDDDPTTNRQVNGYVQSFGQPQCRELGQLMRPAHTRGPDRPAGRRSTRTAAPKRRGVARGRSDPVSAAVASGGGSACSPHPWPRRARTGARRARRGPGAVAARVTEAGPARRAAELATAAGLAGTVLVAHRSRRAAVLSGLALLTGSALQRYGVFAAGVQTTKDPRYVVVPQQERLSGRTVGDPALGTIDR